jgi:NAD(P)-dependent dehydrogenase (short-subunit alcohol dehydrogenase family)
VTTSLFDLTGKVAVITGASKGLGRAMALGFADAGADVVVSSRRVDACEEGEASLANGQCAQIVKALADEV